MIDTDEFLELESSSDQTISDILLEHDISSSDVAACFYQLRKSEKVSAGKLLVYQNAAGELRVNKDVPLPIFSKKFPVQVKPSDVPAGARLFIQSTSSNRGIKANEHILIKFATKRAVAAAVPAAAAAATAGTKRGRSGSSASAAGAAKTRTGLFAEWRAALMAVEIDDDDDDDDEQEWTEADHEKMVDRVFDALLPPANDADFARFEKRVGSPLPDTARSMYELANGQGDIDDYRNGLLTGVMTLRWLPLAEVVRVKDHEKLSAHSFLPRDDVLVAENVGGNGLGVVLLNLATGKVRCGQFLGFQKKASGYGDPREYASLQALFEAASKDVEEHANLLREYYEVNRGDDEGENGDDEDENGDDEDD